MRRPAGPRELRDDASSAAFPLARGKYYIERPSVMQRNRAASRHCGAFYFRVEAIGSDCIERQIPT
jgi:hypothetical protein